ncbi:MAG TPA: Gfo/Idh/MocA family oxidoreductase [bacterium]|nr:Gfo/Idh/MocA family oxidoreductase [bacterium]
MERKEMQQTIGRRFFFKQLAGAATALAAPLAAPCFVPDRALGRSGRTAASERITMGFIGVGGMGTGDLRAFLQKARAQVVAVCDVDDEHLYQARDLVNAHYGNHDCLVFKDFRAVLLRPDIDAVCLALPDHWHALAAVAACRSRKDIYGEKPLAYTISEGRAIVEAVQKHGIVWQTGSQQRSEQNFRYACELVRNGYLGKVSTVRVGLPYGNSIRPGNFTPSTPPAGFDYDMWLGPAPEAPYCEARCHWNFRWISDYAGGQLTDWAGHHIDIAQWGMNTENSAPVEIEGVGEWSDGREGLFDVMNGYTFSGKYAEGFTMIVADSHRHKMGVRFEGEQGWIHVDRGFIEANPSSLLRIRIRPEEVHLTVSTDHHQNFLDCVLSRKKTVAPVETAHHSIMVAHLGLAAIKLGRKLKWDNVRERFIDDAQADRLLSRAMRSPWRIG